MTSRDLSVKGTGKFQPTLAAVGSYVILRLYGDQLDNFHLYQVISHQGGVRAVVDLAIEKYQPFLPAGTGQRH